MNYKLNRTALLHSPPALSNFLSVPFGGRGTSFPFLCPPWPSLINLSLLVTVTTCLIGSKMACVRSWLVRTARVQALSMQLQ